MVYFDLLSPKVRREADLEGFQAEKCKISCVYHLP